MECDILKLIMDKISEYNTAPSGPFSVKTSSAAAAVEEDGNLEQQREQEEGSSSAGLSPAPAPAIFSKHSSVMGHLVLIAQALSVGLDAEGGGPEAAGDKTGDQEALELSNVEEGTSNADGNENTSAAAQ